MRKLDARVKDVNSTRKKYVLLYIMYTLYICVEMRDNKRDWERTGAWIKKNHIINNKQQT